MTDYKGGNMMLILRFLWALVWTATLWIGGCVAFIAFLFDLIHFAGYAVLAVVALDVVMAILGVLVSWIRGCWVRSGGNP